jgi:hypothetical protein
LSQYCYSFEKNDLMKLRATIREEVKASANLIVVEFDGDDKRQHFEVKCNFDPYQAGMRKWDIWDLKIKFESEIFTEEKTGKKSYFTHMICYNARASVPLFDI